MRSALAASVIIPTCNRRTRLARVLEALERQSADSASFDVVVVDDGSTDDTSTWLRDQRHRFRLDVIRQANGGPARARNAGVQMAQRELLVFLDDDVEPSSDLVREHLDSHATSRELVVVGPLGSLPHYKQPWVSWEQAKLDDQYAAMIRGDWEPTFRQFWTGNASILREHVLAVGGFDPTFLRAEDVELGIRLHRRGLRFVFNPAARTLHHAERSLESWENAHRSYGRLEVSIFEREGHDAVIRILAANWGGLNPVTRGLVRACLGRPARYRLASSALKAALKLETSLKKPILADKICSALANLLYWQASIEELGPERAHQVFRHAEASK